MKRQACTLLCAGLLALGAGALAQTATYVFPYEGFRYTQREDETVLTQTNLGEHEALLKSLGTSSEAVLASYVASGIVMEVIPDDGGQIAVSVTDAGKFADVQDMDKMTQEQRLAFLAQFEMSGLYETCAYVDTAPACVRLTSSAMYASMPVYSLRYATLHLGKLYDRADHRGPRTGRSGRRAHGAAPFGHEAAFLAQSGDAHAAGHGHDAADRHARTHFGQRGGGDHRQPDTGRNSGVYDIGEAHAVRPCRGVCGDPGGGGRKAARQDRREEGRQLLPKVRLADEGDHELMVTAGEDTATFTVRYEKAGRAAGDHRAGGATFTGGSVTVRGVTEPNATVYIEGKGMNTNVKAGRTAGSLSACS